jgi:hypothetical protein
MPIIVSLFKSIFKKQYTYPYINMNCLTDYQDQLSEIAILFRTRVCEECAWSIPTYYRKMRSIDTIKGDRIIRAISNAEKEKIIQIGEQLLMQQIKYFKKYKNGGNN